MERSHAGRLRSGRSNSIGNGGLAAPTQSDDRRIRRRVSYGLGLLLFALSVGLAAALFLTVGTANADGALKAECSKHAVFMAGAKSDSSAPRCVATSLSPAQCLYDGRTVPRGRAQV